MAHSSSGLRHRPPKAEAISENTLPPDTTDRLGIAQSLDEYVVYLGNRGVSENYITKFSEYLEKFCDWLGNTLATPCAKSAEEYLSKSSHLKTKSRARYASYLKSFLNYLGKHFDLKVKVPKTLSVYAEVSDIDQIVDWIKNRKTHKHSIGRDLALIETAKKTGMRRGELGNLRIKDIVTDQNRLFVCNGKGDKERVIPMHPDLRESFVSLCVGKTGEEPVFGLKPRSVTNKFRLWAREVGVDLHTHSFRHYFATSLLEKGADIRQYRSY